MQGKREKHSRPPRVKKSEADEKFRMGVEQFNQRKFFEAHETWEEIWLLEPEPGKTFLQGIIQVAAACHHYRRGNARGMQSLLRAGLQKLARFPARHRGLDLEGLRTAARHWVTALGEEQDPGAEQLPRIELDESD